MADGIILTENELQEKLNDAYDLGYQSCLNYKGLTWKEAEELQRYRENPASLRPKGEWITEIIDKEKREIAVSCSECEAFFSLNSFDFGLCYNFCPSCGADMRGEENGN